MMDFEDRYFIVGVDGGATSSEGILMDHTGKTLATQQEGGINLSINQEACPGKILSLIYELCRKANISPFDVDAVGLGLAGSSSDRGRDLVFRELEREKLTRSILITSDAEAAFEVTCPILPGFLISIGTGVICMVKTSDGKIYRTAGLGHDKGDKGSGYWIGRRALLAIAIGETHVYPYEELLALQNKFLEKFDEQDFTVAMEKVAESENRIAQIASLSEPICMLAAQGNELALALLQEASNHVADYIVELANKVDYSEEKIVLGGSGSLCRNDLFRKSLNDALAFDFKDIKWLFSKISPAYGAAILASRVIDNEITLAKIVKQI